MSASFSSASVPAPSGERRIEQAVILAGGRGTRLLPLTLTRPKPMIEFHGRPFLEYLIAMLAEQGICRVLLLLGYLPDAIRNHFGDGEKFGVRIEYVVGDVDLETGGRLKQAEDRLDPDFLLLYCDNYWPLPLAQLWSSYLKAGRSAQVTVYNNRDGYTRSNLSVDARGLVTIYDKSRKTPGLQGVDIGFILMRREVVGLLPGDGNVSFEAEIYPRLVADRQLAAFQTDHRYYSVGDHARLPITEAFLADRPAIFLDRDGTLNRRMPHGRHVADWSEWEWLPGTRTAVKRLHEAGYRIFLVTGQTGIADGAMSRADVDAIHENMRRDLLADGIAIDGIYLCPHGPDEGCGCRKPEPGLLFQAQAEHHLNLAKTPLIGDDECAAAATAAGCPFRAIGADEGLLGAVEELLSEMGSRHPAWNASGR